MHRHVGATWLGGAVGSHKVDTRGLCPFGVADVHIYQRVTDGLLAGLTLGIYTPTTVDFRCRLTPPATGNSQLSQLSQPGAL
jgi:hypothetical protein